MKIAIIGGHMSPALALIQELQARNHAFSLEKTQGKKQIELLYIGRKHPMEGDSAVSLEYQTIRALDIRFIDFHTGRLQRTFTKHTLPSLVKIPKGLIAAISLLKREKPDVVVGFGGYVSVPIGIAAKMLGIPLIIHEQTSEAGLANKILASFADTVCIAWKSSESFFPKKKTILTGNPMVVHAVTGDVKKYHRLDPKIPMITIVGGSQGSHAINSLIESILPRLIEEYQIIHQTGDAKEFSDYNRLLHLRKMLPTSLQPRYSPVKFIAPGDIQKVFEDSDLVISRAGINTITQLLLMDKPALLIPLVTGQRQEQWNNAQMVKKTGLGEVYDQDALTGSTLLRAIQTMLAKRKFYHNHDLSNMQQLHTNAAGKLVDILSKRIKN